MNTCSNGFTLVELVIVLAVMAILVLTALPAYQTYMLRVHRGEAVRMLLSAAMCQEQIHARSGQYDTALCLPDSKQKRYKLSYLPVNTQGQAFTVIANPQGAQQIDPCGSLLLEQSGLRRVSPSNANVTDCWNGR